MRWCDEHQIQYILGLPKKSRLLESAQRWTTQAAEQFEQSCTGTECSKQRLFGEFQYAAGTWDQERRVIVKAEYSPAGLNTRFIVANLPVSLRNSRSVRDSRRHGESHQVAAVDAVRRSHELRSVSGQSTSTATVDVRLCLDGRVASRASLWNQVR